MKQTQILLFLLLMILSSTEILAQKDSIVAQRAARTLVREGNELYQKEKYDDASIAYRKALDKNSQYKKATYNLGNAMYQTKNFKEAVPQYELAVKAAKDKFEKADGYHNIGNAMLEQKQYQPAVDAFKNALRNDPTDDETRYNLAVAQKLLEKEKQDQKKDKDKNKDKKDKDKKDKDDKNKDKNKDNKDGKDKDKKDDKDKGDKNKDDQKDPKKKDEKDQKQKPKPKKGQMSPQQIKQLLESLNNEEKKTQKKMNAKKAKGKKVKQEKDW